MGRFKWQSKVTLAAFLLGAITIGFVYLLPQQQAKGKTLALPLNYEFLPSDLLINFKARPALLSGNKVPRWLMCSDEENRPLGDGGSSWASKLFLITAGHRLLFVEFSPRIDEGNTVVTEISVFLNETRCRTSQMAEHLGLFRVEVPAGTVHAGNNTVEIHAPINARLRPQRLALLRDPDVPFESLDWSSPVKVAADTGHLVVQREGRVILPFMVPPGARSFACDLDVEDYGNRGEATCRLVLDRPLVGTNDFTNRERTSRILGRKGLPVELGLDDSGEHAFILDIESLSPDAALTISRFRLVVDPQSEEQTMTDPTPPRKAGPNTNSRHPDVIVIILDAARTDHFEAFGYPRSTTPFLASLAEESLLFDNVYAQAPYTVCSVPTMMTGLSFATHGVVGKGSHRLSEFETTLAEHLGEMGYQTVGISSTPKHSTASGANQGYDEFHEVWGRVKKLALDPAPLVKQAEVYLRAANRDRPLFMMLHMLPPHAPYQPPDEHDIFRRPGHERGDTDSIDFIQSIEKGERVPSDDELGDLVALYDGNLRWVDKAVESVVDVLRETRD
ncbi:MAG: sulfatase-like hydrolase/transferase, partial [Thermoanaerobaculales bacterium]|nr:sulfatase-like hydrolase/transferase [Thermoanaerobaculales bacterium]